MRIPSPNSTLLVYRLQHPLYCVLSRHIHTFNNTAGPFLQGKHHSFSSRIMTFISNGIAFYDSGRIIFLSFFIHYCLYHELFLSCYIILKYSAPNWHFSQRKITAFTVNITKLSKIVPNIHIGIINMTKLSGIVQDVHIRIIDLTKLSGIVQNMQKRIINMTKLSGIVQNMHIGIINMTKLSGIV